MLGLLATLTGCSTYHARPIDPEASASALQARRLDDPDLIRFVTTDLHRSAPPVRWDLDTLTAVAVYERPDMKIAAGQVAIALAGEVTASAWPNPVLSIAPAYNVTRNYDIESISPTISAVPASPWTVGPVVTQLLRTGGKRDADIAKAAAETRAARAVIAVAAWQVRSEVRSTLINLWSAQRRLDLSHRHAALSAAYARAIEQRYRAGMISAAQVTTARLAQTQAALALAADQRQTQIARAGLATALGLPAKAIDGMEIDWTALDHPPKLHGLAELRHQALTSRPDVLEALARYAATQASLRLAIAQQYPDLNIGPGYEYSQNNNSFVLGVSLPLPIFNQNQGPIAAARAARHVAAARFEQVQAAALAQVESAEADWRASQQEAARADDVLRIAADAEHREAVSFASGGAGRVRLLGARVARIEAELGALSAAIDERAALGRLEDALHHPLLKTTGT
ncbi:MAG TPA: TolC family protein [Rhodopila sp.]|nr:TolC family protein [Rhodopila sp.]